jgi:hypothetical protein
MIRRAALRGCPFGVRRHRDQGQVGGGPPVFSWRGCREGRARCSEAPVVTVDGDARVVERRLGAGRLRCPGCGGSCSWRSPHWSCRAWRSGRRCAGRGRRGCRDGQASRQDREAITCLNNPSIPSTEVRNDCDLVRECSQAGSTISGVMGCGLSQSLADLKRADQGAGSGVFVQNPPPRRPLCRGKPSDVSRLLRIGNVRVTVTRLLPKAGCGVDAVLRGEFDDHVES